MIKWIIVSSVILVISNIIYVGNKEFFDTVRVFDGHFLGYLTGMLNGFLLYRFTRS